MAWKTSRVVQYLMRCSICILLSVSYVALGCEESPSTQPSSEGGEAPSSDLSRPDQETISDQMIDPDLALVNDLEVPIDVTLPEPDMEIDPDPEGIAPGEVNVLQLQEIRALNFGAFTTSLACSLCHSNHFAATAMRNSAGDEIGPYNLWRGSMMANASRDPFWWAQVASEVALNPPEKQEYIEGECIRCHAPALARTARESAGREGRMSDLKGNSHPAMVGVDGVACTTCHQILPDGLGEPETFSGNYKVNDERLIFGPHRNPATAPMINHVDYTPTHATHVTESKLCASCHTLVHAEGEATAEIGDGEPRENWGFPEQTPYLEWRNSIYNNEEDPDNPEGRTCQSCHQPTYDDEGPIRTRIARSPPGGDFLINPRVPFGQHTFVGGNAILPQIMKQERATLNPSGTDAVLDLISEIAVQRLETSASLEVNELERASESLSFKVNIQTLTGHKLPTGFPSRRVWIKVKVTNASGETLFASGRYNAQGRILGADDQVLPSEQVYGPIEPHHQIIERADQVQIYQAVMADEQGAYTHAITRAKGWVKDNRLLPAGYRADHPEARYTQPIGIDDDSDFIGGSDQITYRIALPANAGPLEVRVSLLYQTLGARFVRSLFQVDRPEVAAFRTMYERADVSPILMADQQISVP